METTTETENVELVEPSRPITELFQEWFGDSALVRVLANSMDVIVQTLVIVVAAWIAVFIVRRVIRRAVRRAGDAVPTAEQERPEGRLAFALGEVGAPRVSARRAQRAKALGAMAESIVRVVIWAIAIIMILGTTFGVNLGPLIAGAGIIGIALGFGAQSLVRDFLSGLFMLGEDQFGVGDAIDIGDAVGIVEGVSLRTTRVRDVTGTLWHVPNGEILRVGNMSQEWSRALLDIGIAYGADVDTASDVIRRVASEMAHEEEYGDLFLDEPEVWGVENLGLDGVDIRLVIKTQPGKQWPIARELRRRIKNAFDAAGIEIPFPQRTVWLRTEQQLAVGDAGAEGFAQPEHDDEAVRRALLAARRGDTSLPPADYDDVRKEVIDDTEPPRPGSG